MTVRTGLVIGLAVFGLAANPTTKPLTLESLSENISVSDPQFSPGGTRLAFVSNKSGSRKVWIISVDGTNPHVLIADDGTESSPRWSPDGKTIAFLRSENRQSDIWSVTADGTNLTRITNDAEGERAITWSPDGLRLAFISDRAKSQDIYVVPSAGGPVEQLTVETNPWDEGRWEPCWSPDGRWIAYVSNRSEPFADDLWLVDASTKASQKVTANLHVMSTPVWSPDGKHVAFNAMKTAEFWYGDQSDIYVVEMPDRTVRKVETNIYVSDGNGNLKMAWTPDSRFLVFRYEWEGNDNLWSVPVGGGAATKMTYEAGSFGSFDVSRAGGHIAYVRSTPVSGGELQVLDMSGGPPRQLTDWFEDYDGIVAPTQMAFRSTDGRYILGYLFRPPDFDRSREYPSLVQVHGGGNNAYGNAFHAMEHWLAGEGFVVLAIEYRGSAGHGREFQDLALGEWAAGQGWDAVAASRYLSAQPWSNGKVGIYGGSYGGIMSMAAVTRDSSAFAAAAPFYGVFDWEDAYAHADRLMQFWIIEGHLGFKPGENPTLFEHTASIRHLDRVSKDLPFLIIHGERDRRAPFQQSQRLAEALKARGNPVEFHSYPEEGHGFRLPKNRLHAYGRLLAFFNTHLRGTSPEAKGGHPDGR